MAIEVGERLPEATLYRMTDEGPISVSVSELVGSKKVILFAVPGAFTPTCHQAHVPGFINNYETFKAKGIDDIFCLAVNDPFVLQHWSDSLGSEGKVDFLSDGNSELTKAIGMELDGTGIGLGMRSQRYSMLIEDGIVKQLNIEEVPSTADQSSAEKLLENL